MNARSIRSSSSVMRGATPTRLPRPLSWRGVTCSVAQSHSGMELVKSKEQYTEMYNRSIKDPAGFWGDIATQFHWEKKWDDDHFSYNFDPTKGKVFTEFFKGGLTNISYNCLDRHIEAGLGDKPCILFEGNEPGFERKFTYSEVLDQVSQLLLTSDLATVTGTPVHVITHTLTNQLLTSDPATVSGTPVHVITDNLTNQLLASDQAVHQYTPLPAPSQTSFSPVIQQQSAVH
eukprot:gene4794-34552_t